MDDELKKKILIDVEAKTERLKQNAVDLNVTLDAMKKKLKDVEIESGKNSVAYQHQASKIRITQQAIRDNNRELDNASKAIKLNSNSIAQNRALVATLTAEHIKLSQAEGASSNAAKAMEQQLKSVLDVLKAQTKAYGDHRLEVGHYELATEKLNKTNAQATQGFAKVEGSLYRTAGGFGFLPQSILDAKDTMTGFIQTQRTMIQGFQQHSTLLEKAEEASRTYAEANNAVETATEVVNTAQEALAATQTAHAEAALAATAAQEALAVGEISEAEAATAAATAQNTLAASEAAQAEVSAAVTVQTEAQAAATVAQTAATEANTVATNAGTASLKLLKVALASTGIGVLIILLGTLYSYFTESNEGANRFKVILNQLSELFGEITERLAPIGKAIFDAFTNTSGVQFFASILMSALIPLRTILQVLYDIKNGNFKQAFIDIGTGVKDWAANQVTGIKAGLQMSKELAVNVSKAAKEVGKDLNLQSFKDVAKEAGAIAEEKIKLAKAERIWSEEKIRQQGILDVLKLKMRDMGLTEQQRLAAGQKAKAISDQIFQTELKNAEKHLEIVNRQSAMDGKKDYQSITDAKNRVQELKNAHASEIQSIQNRESKITNIVSKETETRAQKMAKALTEAENIRSASLTRQLQTTFDAYGAEILAQNQHYEDELTKLKKLQAEKLITISKFNEVKRQLEAEHQANIAQVVEKFTKADAEAVLQAQNELYVLHNQSLQDEMDAQIAILEQQTKEKLETLANEHDELKDQEVKQANEIAIFIANKQFDEAKALEASHQKTLELLKINGQKRIEIERQTQQAIYKIQQAQIDKMAMDQAAADVLKTSSPGMEAAHLVALKNQLQTEYDLKIANEAKFGNDTYLLRLEYLNKLRLLDQEYNQSKVDAARALEQDIQSFTFGLLSNSLQRNTNLKIASLQKQRDAELNNTSLTTAQRSIIDEKYRKKEAQEKVKEFKSNQKLSIAQALINGFLAMLKTSANVGFPLSLAFSPMVAAQTAIAVAGIAMQKPPAYNRGGLHYVSDGKGALLSGPGTGTSDSMNARLSNGESVINANSTRMFNPLLSALNVLGGGRAFGGLGHAFTSSPAFASGGVFTRTDTYLPTIDNGLRPANITVTNAGFGELSTTLNNLPGDISNAMKQVTILADVKDVNYQQQVLARVEDRVNL